MKCQLTGTPENVINPPEQIETESVYKDALIAYFDHVPQLSLHYDYTYELGDKVNRILADDEDDKLGRIKDCYIDAKSNFADFVIGCHNIGQIWAKLLIEDAMKAYYGQS